MSAPLNEKALAGRENRSSSGNDSTETQGHLGGAFGLALLVTLAVRSVQSDVAAGIAPPVAAANGYSLAIVICAVLLAIGGLLSLLLMENFKPEPPPGVGSPKGEGESGAEPDAETPVLGAARTIIEVYSWRIGRDHFRGDLSRFARSDG